MVNSRRASNNVKSLLESTVDPESAILDLRRQKIESKFYHTKVKFLPKQMKKVKVFLVQRVVKKIKQTTSADSASADNSELESELTKAKALDHVKLALWAFNTQIITKDEYLRGKCQELGVKVEDEEELKALELTFPLDKIMGIKCFQDAVKGCKAELVLFIQKLLHEAPPEKKIAKVTGSKERRQQSQLGTDKSFFMSSLNEGDSDNEQVDGRVTFSDDEEDDDDKYNAFEEPVVKKKKNRLGQLARRRLAEKNFGTEAKHIKSGGLTVQQKEEERKQKSIQKRERDARIKKDAIRTERLNKKKAGDESVNEFKKASGIKIDANMHPSWAAKLQQQAKAQQATFSGKKIKFDE